MWALSGSDLGQISPIIWTPPFQTMAQCHPMRIVCYDDAIHGRCASYFVKIVLGTTCLLEGEVIGGPFPAFRGKFVFRLSVAFFLFSGFTHFSFPVFRRICFPFPVFCHIFGAFPVFRHYI